MNESMDECMILPAPIWCQL